MSGQEANKEQIVGNAESLLSGGRESDKEKAAAVTRINHILEEYFGGGSRSPVSSGPGKEMSSGKGEEKLEAMIAVLEEKIKAQSRMFEDNQLAILNMLEDLHESKEEISRSKTNFLNIAENNSDGIIVMDSKGFLCFMNPVAEKILGYPKEELLNKSIGYALRPGETREIEIPRENQPKVVAEMRGERIIWENQEAFMAVIRDVTYYRMAEAQLRESFEKLRRIQLETVEALSSAGEKRDPFTAGHQHRVSLLACAIAEEMNLLKNEIEGIRVAALLHDIGKIYVPDKILTKPGRLDETEFEMVKSHPQYGYDILKPIEFPWPVAQIVLQHHERLDGSGYPSGLTAENILRESKIVAIADVVEAMSYDRPYRPALSMDIVFGEITKQKGALYDSETVEACRRLFVEKGYRLPK